MVVFIVKGWLLVFVMMWVRWTLPRLRIDQVMMTCLKYLLPISCVLLLGVSLWQVAMPTVVLALSASIVLCAACLPWLVVWLAFKLVTTHEQAAAAAVPGRCRAHRRPRSGARASDRL